MNAINTNERKTENSVRKGKVLDILKKILLYTVVTVVVVFALVAICQILKFLFVGAILFLAWICPKRWW